MRRSRRPPGLSKGAVSKYVSLADAKGVGWPLPEGVDEAALERLLFADTRTRCQFAEPDCLELHQEFKRKGVTLQLLWAEYTAARRRGTALQSVLPALSRLARPSTPLDAPATHRRREAVHRLLRHDGAVHRSVQGRDGRGPGVRRRVGCVVLHVRRGHAFPVAARLVGSHQRALSYFGGAPVLLVPDNLKSAVTRACRYEPKVNRTYKAKAEVGVQIVERWILARLRHYRFHALSETNTAVATLLVELNERRFQRSPYSRRELFERLDRPAMRALPEQPYEYAEWRYVKLGIDHHVEVGKRLYSVPHTLIGHRLEAHVTANRTMMSGYLRCIARPSRVHVLWSAQVYIRIGAAEHTGQMNVGLSRKRTPALDVPRSARPTHCHVRRSGLSRKGAFSAAASKLASRILRYGQQLRGGPPMLCSCASSARAANASRLRSACSL